MAVHFADGDLERFLGRADLTADLVKRLPGAPLLFTLYAGERVHVRFLDCLPAIAEDRAGLAHQA